MSENILLESGTNELEIVVFKVGDSILGVNVAKVESIIPFQPITVIPNSHRNVKGVIDYRGRIMPVIDLIQALKKQCAGEVEKRLLILVHINNIDFAIEVSAVVGIKRFSWKEIEIPSSILVSKNETPITGIVKGKEGENVLILDLEKIIADIDSALALKESKVTDGLEGKKIVVAEDSVFIIKVINESLIKAGAIVEKFSNGKEALDYLEGVKEDEICCVITDIEMPIMDGFTLTKNIKSNNKLKDIPVVLFSSLVNDSLRHKGVSVGADAQITKPEIDKLVNVVISLDKKRKLQL